MSAGDDILPADGDFEASRGAGSPRIFDALGRFFRSFTTVLRATEGGRFAHKVNAVESGSFVLAPPRGDRYGELFALPDAVS